MSPTTGHIYRSPDAGGADGSLIHTRHGLSADPQPWNLIFVYGVHGVHHELGIICLCKFGDTGRGQSWPNLPDIRHVMDLANGEVALTDDCFRPRHT